MDELGGIRSAASSPVTGSRVWQLVRIDAPHDVRPLGVVAHDVVLDLAVVLEPQLAVRALPGRLVHVWSVTSTCSPDRAVRPDVVGRLARSHTGDSSVAHRPGSVTTMNQSASLPASLPRRVVVGIDASRESLAALDFALRLVIALGARLIVVHGIGLLEEGGYRPRPDIDGLVAAARGRSGIQPTSTSTSCSRTDRPLTSSCASLSVRGLGSSSLAAAGWDRRHGCWDP